MDQIITNIPEAVLQLPDDYEMPVQNLSESELSAPNIDSLNKQQRMAFELMFNYCTAEEVPYATMLFEGYAGTGKTYTIAQLIKKLIMVSHKHIAVTAPTNKAVKVLKKTTKMQHALLQFRTIHSLLGLKEDNDENGKQIFVASTDPEDEQDIMNINVLILDEASQLPDELFLGTETFRGIKYYIENEGLRVIFMGDPIQIPPVNQPDAIPFIEGHRLKYDIYRVALTDVIRQKGGNPILELATTTRQHVQYAEIPYDYNTELSPNGGIIMINRADKESLYKVCAHYFGNVRFNLDPDFVKVIAWTNKTVDFMNDKIRREIYKSYVIYESIEDTKGKLPKIIPGEKMIADKPIFVEKDDGFGGKRRVMVLTTNDEFEVVNYEVLPINVFGNFNVTVYRTKVSWIDERNKKRGEVIDIVHESGEIQYRQVLEALKKIALAERDKYERKKKWRNYYSIKSKFAEVKYNYAVTAHKSQGSTYDNCIVIEPDINKNFKTVERNRIKYVAYTRSRNLLFIVK